MGESPTEALSAIRAIAENSDLSELCIAKISGCLATLHSALDCAHSQGSTRGAGAEPYLVRALADCSAKPVPEVVQGFLGAGSVAALVGVPGGGKTALAVDIGLHVAAGRPWFEKKVTAGPVIYVAAEAPGSVITRAQAAARRKFPDETLAFYVVRAVPRLGDDLDGDVDADRVVATVLAVSTTEGMPVRAVIIDTAASVLGNGDENAGGMIRLSVAAKRIAEATEAAVIIVHHPSKADGSALRGHSSLAAAADTIIAITKDDLTGVRTATLVKSRDHAAGSQLCYELEIVGLPEPDAFGDPRTAILVSPATVQHTRQRPAGKAQEALLGELERRHRTGETTWAEAAVREAGRQIGQHRNSAAKALAGLRVGGYVVGGAAGLSLAYPPEANP